MLPVRGPLDPPVSNPFFIRFFSLFVMISCTFLLTLTKDFRYHILFIGIVVLSIFYISSIIFHNFVRPIRKVRSPTNQFKQINWFSENNELVVHFEKWNDGIAPLIIGIHGWQSDSSSTEYKIQPFIDSGYHAIMIDLPGHGLSDGLKIWTAVESGQRILSMLENEVRNWDTSKIDSIVLFGHSIGGFLVLRFADKINSVLPIPISHVYLESPMTSFPLVYKQRTKGWKFISGLIAQLDLNWAFRRDGPDIDIIWKNFEVPDWGIPTIPVRILQAQDDIALALDHLDLLRPYAGDDWEIIIDPNLKHFGRGKDRGNALEIYDKWIKQ
ncbi:MAG: alpha/beta hydrolase [Candidatus Thermoplasmatota archaeon]|nr:alpha/beta hydrolase [Candidatus Thermoplasmatota archaeon]